MADEDALTLNIKEMLQLYQDMNGSTVERLSHKPTALQFMSYVARNRPFLVPGGCLDFPAVQQWNVQYLMQALGDGEVEVSQTPAGNADAVVNVGRDALQFAKPYQKRMPFRQLISSILMRHPDSPVCYLQAQNDNLRSEHTGLFPDGDEALGAENLDAVNFWLGSADSVTALHRDNYENTYCQIVGQKHFVLLPPIAAAAVNEQWLPNATYDCDMNLQLDNSGSTVPCAIWDPDIPDSNMTPLSSCCAPLRVTLDPGDMLYLPACWYHKVSQTNSVDGINCSVNYWYDQDYSSTLQASNDFIRRLAWSTFRKG